MWVLPTLSRAKQCLAVLDQIKKMECSTPGVVFINGSIEEYTTLQLLPDNWEIVLATKNIGALGALNSIFKAHPNEPFYGFIGDDEFVLTKKWDTKLIAAAGDWDISHGDDGIHHGKRAQGYLCIGGKLARAVGYLAIPEAWHWYGLDDMWETLAKAGAIKKVYVPTVYVNHKHAYIDKAPMDSCYELGASRKDQDYQVYLYWLRTQIKHVIQRIKEAKENDK